MGKNTDKLLVSKSNHLIETGYKLTLNEQRLILIAISKLDGRKPFPKDNEFIITAQVDGASVCFGEIIKPEMKRRMIF